MKMGGRQLVLLAACLLVGCHTAPPQDASAKDEIDWGHFDPEAEEKKAAERAKREAQAQAVADGEARRRSLPTGPRSMRVRRGHEPPPGYTEVMRPNWVLFGVGVGMFAVSYGLPALTAARLVQEPDNNAWTMLVPVAGPILQIGYMVDHFSRNGGPGLGLIGYAAVGTSFMGLAALSVLQLGGIVLPVLAFTEKKPLWLRSDLALVNTPRLGANLRFTGTSLEVVGRF